MMIRLLTNRDNLGRIQANSHLLKGLLFPKCENVQAKEIKKGLEVLDGEGIIIVYEVNGLDYLVFPKLGRFSRIEGNMSNKSNCPAPPHKKVKEWEKKFKDGFKPCMQKKETIDLTEEFEVLRDPQFREIWKDWLDMRKKMRIPNTARSMRIALKKLEKHSVSKAKAMVEQSVERGWRGIFPLKEDKYGNKKDFGKDKGKKYKNIEKNV